MQSVRLRLCGDLKQTHARSNCEWHGRTKAFRSADHSQHTNATGIAIKKSGIDEQTCLSERPPVSGLSGGKGANWIKLSWKKLLGRKKQLMLAGTGLVVLGLGAFYFWGNQPSSAQYMTAKVERGNLRNTVTATGTLQAVTTVQVGSQASGTIAALYADFNSVVKKGQVIAQLDPSMTKAQVDQARANLQQAQASLQQARAGVVNSRAGVSDAQAKALAAKSSPVVKK
jgi:hypothetical protein